MPTRRVLVPLLVLALALGLWLWPGFGGSATPGVTAESGACMLRLREIHLALVQYKVRTGHAPMGAGHEFPEALFTAGVWEDTQANRERLSCPSSGRAYAARDAKAFPLPHFPAGGAANEPIAACDGGDHLPHAEGVNVLYSDGSVRTLLLESEIALGHLQAGATRMPVGPDSPVPELRKLRAR